MMMSLRSLVSVIAIAFTLGIGMYNGVHDMSHVVETLSSIEKELNPLQPMTGSEQSKIVSMPYKNWRKDIIREPIPRPSAKALFDGSNVTGDVSWLLNLAIIGFGKCGTSSMVGHFSQHKQISMMHREHCEFTWRDDDTILLKALESELPHGNYMRGLKCPSLPSIFRTFDSSLEFGIQSFVRQRQFGYSLFPAHKLIGKCQDLGPNKKVHGVCTEEARFQEALIGLGKTSMSTTDEMQYFLSSEKKPENLTVISQMKVFVYDIAQVEDKDEERSQLFMDDMQTFLQMTEPFKPMGQKSGGKTKQSRIDICEQKYDHLREALLDIGVNASRWIRRFFVPAEGVTVSSPKFFEQSLAKWEIDPCEERRANNTFPPK
ncbi:predicted protein [Phaeodactylum tricornutum CCAP 1055/1]|uniref:Sulfotransferase n=3 Tax=Phaeodactylum tricornutum TaxID=2850 RepID=B7FPX4_PHATC|nr:predicted protein [Phaeodactylum tricornutum CCAP 1055/1]EEC51248.1 predicted protein [Phaeodactylum tricornutum CCAP 1055/1]|eukprot:XP_002176785.1 predicted protein [Phaeodactylum tricornutum CCAP 1055/1]